MKRASGFSAHGQEIWVYVHPLLRASRRSDQPHRASHRSSSRVDRYPDEESLPIHSHRIKNVVRCFFNCAGFCAKQSSARAPFGYNAWRAVQLSSFPYLVAPPTTQGMDVGRCATHATLVALRPSWPRGVEFWFFLSPGISPGMSAVTWIN